MAGNSAVLSPKARDDLAGIANSETRRAVIQTMEGLSSSAGGRVGLWSAFPLRLYIGVPTSSSSANTDLRSLDPPENEPDGEDLEGTYFVIYKNLTGPQSAGLEHLGRPSFLVLRIVRLVEIVKGLPWAAGFGSGFLTFIETSDRAVVEEFLNAFRNLLSQAGYEIVYEGRDEWGSWTKSIIARIRKSEAPQRLAEGLAAAANDTYLRKPAASATRDLAEAAKASLEAMGDEEGCHVFDGLLVVKRRDDDGHMRSLVKELTIEERKILRENTLDPRTILQELATRSREMDELEASGLSEVNREPSPPELNP